MDDRAGRRDASVLSMLFGDGTPRKAFLTALVVGTLLTMINHGDQIFQGNWPPLAKVALTYFVPYCVTTWGAFTGKRALMRRQAGAENREVAK